MVASIWQGLDPILAAEFSALVSYQPGTLRRAVKDRAVCITDFPFYADPTGATDSTTGIQAALDSGVKKIYVPEGTFLHRKLIWPLYYVEFYGPGTLKLAVGEYRHIFLTATCLGWIHGITFDSSNMSAFTYSAVETYCAIGTNPVGGVNSDFVVSDCKFLGLRNTGGQNIHAIQSSFGKVKILRCYVQQCGGDAFNCNGEHSVVAFNEIDQCGDGAIAFNNRAAGLIFGNYIKKASLGIGAGPQGTTADPEHSMLVIANRIAACDHGILAGWFSFAGRESIVNTVIANNQLFDCKSAGIRNDGRAAGSPGNVSVLGNIIKRAGSNAYDGTSGAGIGIIWFNSEDVDISHNQVIDCAGDGIYTSECKPTITANKIIRVGGVGIESLTADAIIANNVVRGGSNHGIAISGNSTSVTGNKVKSNTQSGIRVRAGGVDVVIENNDVQNNGGGIILTDPSFIAGTRVGPNIVKNNTTNFTNVYNKSAAQFKNFYLTGTADGSGNISLAHGCGSSFPYDVVKIDAYIKGNLGEAIPMTLTAADATNIICTSSAGYAGRPVKISVTLDPQATAW